MSLSSRRATLTLGVTQTIGYASSIYLPATLAEPMARSAGITPSVVFMALSAALLLQVVSGPWIGRLVDRRGGRAPLAFASLLFAAGLAGLALSETAIQLFVAWFVVGLAMAAGLYDTAFAALVGWLGSDARRPITGVTLIAGFASTIGWPLTGWLEHHLGWRGACLVWAGANLALALPLHLSLPRGPTVGPRLDDPPHGTAWSRGDGARMALVALAFAMLAAVGSAMSAALPRTLVVLGAEPAAAVAAAALLGPAQVAARLGELLLVRRIHPLQSGRLAAVFVAVGIGLLAAAGPGAALAAAGLYGAGIGLFTIVRGSLPLALFGDKDYGHRLGVLSVPGRLLQAISPFLFALGAERSPRLALGGLVAACLLAMLALAMLRVRDHQP